MTNQEYHNKTEYLSKSLLDLVHKSPAHFQAYLQGEQKDPTPAMLFGSLVHSVILGQEDYAVAPQCDRRTKEGKAIYEAFVQESEGKEIIATLDQYQQALKIKEAVLSHPKAAALLSEGIAEKPIFGQLGGVPARCKPDFLNTKYNVCIDIKTTSNSSPDEFAKSVWNFRYHVQAAMYLDLTRAQKFFFIAVEKDAPYNCEVYELDVESIEIGRQEYLADIETYKECLKTQNWHGYTETQDIHIISLPNWAKK